MYRGPSPQGRLLPLDKVLRQGLLLSNTATVSLSDIRFFFFFTHALTRICFCFIDIGIALGIGTDSKLKCASSLQLCLQLPISFFWFFFLCFYFQLNFLTKRNVTGLVAQLITWQAVTAVLLSSNRHTLYLNKLIKRLYIYCRVTSGWN